ncbi:hypothetical protein WA026_008542 [Henosepilachna vigintioctopunctata]|uniref:Uncharacterized protein n=1 Tax=Henosepilachna vigintioctopunctata TaxID=420089 RepID=A0AAW1UAQ4_9CUCU
MCFTQLTNFYLSKNFFFISKHRETESNYQHNLKQHVFPQKRCADANTSLILFTLDINFMTKPHTMHQPQTLPLGLDETVEINCHIPQPQTYTYVYKVLKRLKTLVQKTYCFQELIKFSSLLFTYLSTDILEIMLLYFLKSLK